jgi:Galactose oxidase, central domain
MSIEAPVMTRHRGPWPRALAGVGVVAMIGAGVGAYLGIRVVQGAGSAGAAGQPPARTNAAMAFDAADGTVVLFGGEGKSGSLRDTWSWNGSGWTQAHPSTSPPALSGAQMTFDPVSHDLVLVGAEPFKALPLTGHACPITGSGSVSGSAGSTGTGSGSTVSIPPGIAQPANAPQPDGSLTSPRMLPGCGISGGENSATWLWNGSDWSRASVSTPSVGFGGWTLATDPISGRALLLATQPFIEPMLPVVQPDIACPVGTTVTGGAHAQPGCPVFPLTNTTWMWTGHTWKALKTSPNTSSIDMIGRSVVDDAVTGRLAIFGSGFSPYPALPVNCPTCRTGGAPVPVGQAACCTGTVSLWDGSGWRQAASYSNGPMLSGGTFVGDPATHNDVYLSASGQTWVWDGSWTRKHPHATPATLDGASAVFDAASGQVVRFGGFGSTKHAGGLYDQTWAWDGTTWTLRAGSAGPTVIIPIPSPVAVPPSTPCEMLPLTTPPVHSGPQPQAICPVGAPATSAGGGASTGTSVSASGSGVIAP